MLNFIGGLHSLITMVEVLAFLLISVSLFFLKLPSVSRQSVIWIGAVWIGFVTSEYWILGPNSFVMRYDEGEFSLANLLYLDRWFLGGNYAHGIIGGTDARTIQMINTSPFSLERLAFHFFPPWLGLSIHKAFVTGLSFCGAYQLARHIVKTDRWAALAIAAAISGSHLYLTSITLHTGFIGYSIVPFAVYIFIFRIDKPRYFIEVSLISAVIALGVSPTFGGMAIGSALLITWAATGFPQAWKFFAAICVLVLIIFVVWSETLLAFAQNAPMSFRGLEDQVYRGSNSLYEKFFGAMWSYLDRSKETLLPVMVSLYVLFLCNFNRFVKAVAILVAGMAIGPTLLIFPWKMTPLSFVGGVDFNYMTYAMPTIVILVCAWAIRESGEAFRINRSAIPLITFAFLVVAGGQVLALKLYHSAQWLGMGGQGNYSNYINLAERDWEPTTPFRVATVPYRLDPNTTATYGLESFDGFTNLIPGNQARFWMYGMPHAEEGAHSGILHITKQNDMDFLCCKLYEADEHIDLDALKLGNVEFIISLLALSSNQLVLVSGPDGKTNPPRRDDPFIDKLKGNLDFSFISRKVYVYRLKGALPRAYSARTINIENLDKKADKYFKMIKLGLEQNIMVSTTDSSTIGAKEPIGNAQVHKVEKVRDGYDIELNAPDGAVIVLNAIWNPFWRAYVNDQPHSLEVVEANAIHSAVRVPPGTNKLSFRYERPGILTILSRSTAQGRY